MNNIFHKSASTVGSVRSELFDNETFYTAFLNDLRASREVVIIESPFITRRRLASLIPTFNQLLGRGVRITINTRSLLEGADPFWSQEAAEAIALLQCLGITVLYTVRHHRKLANKNPRGRDHGVFRVGVSQSPDGGL